jgi:hypothetical protein
VSTQSTGRHAAAPPAARTWRAAVRTAGQALHLYLVDCAPGQFRPWFRYLAAIAAGAGLALLLKGWGW